MMMTRGEMDDVRFPFALEDETRKQLCPINCARYNFSGALTIALYVPR